MGAVTKGLVGGSPATAQVDRFFILYDPSLGIYDSEATANLQGATFVYFKESFNILHAVGD